MKFVVLLTCAFVAASGLPLDSQETSRVVYLQQGSVRGFKAPNFDIIEFFNIPYATAPTGVDKFKAPLPPPTWPSWNVFDAVDRRIICPQLYTDYIGPMDIWEDCLVANIHVPITEETNLPVVVSIHGGAYFFGYGAQYAPNDFINEKKIIFVTFNYRLGAHGFLCLGTEDAPGNAGMKDQVALMRWVKANIASFGGDPEDITLFGCSTGGSSVDLHLVSKTTYGLFNKAALGSGSCMNPFATQVDPLENARNLARNHGLTNVENVTALGEFYKNVPLSELFVYSSIFYDNFSMIFEPCIENDIGQERFLEESPGDILRSGNFKIVPIMYSYTSHEGLFRISVFERDMVVMNEDFSAFLPADLQFQNQTERAEVANRIKQFYFGDRVIDETEILNYIDFIGDAFFIGGIMRSIPLWTRAGHNEVYLQEYTFVHRDSTEIPYTGGQRGANHCDNFNIIMDESDPERAPEGRIQMAHIQRDLLNNFIRTGNPTPPEDDKEFPLLPMWPPVTRDRSPHYVLGNTIAVAGRPLEERAAFWDDIYERYEAVYQPPRP